MRMHICVMVDGAISDLCRGRALGSRRRVRAYVSGTELSDAKVNSKNSGAEDSGRVSVHSSPPAVASFVVRGAPGVCFDFFRKSSRFFSDQSGGFQLGHSVTELEAHGRRAFLRRGSRDPAGYVCACN